MKRILLIASLLLTGLSSYSQKDLPPQLIVRGDDMGFSHAGNMAIKMCYEEGIETTIEVLVPSPWFPEAVDMLHNMPDVDIGIHLTLTSEWDNIKYRPLSNCPSLINSDGYFYPFIYPNKNYPGQALMERTWKLEDIEREFRAQIELAQRKIAHISHVSAHMGCFGMRQDVQDLVARLAREYEIDIDPAQLDVVSLQYGGPSVTAEEKKSNFIRVLRELKHGQKYLFVDHPGLDMPELRAIYHIGYKNVAEDRQGVTDVWTDPEIRTLITNLGIKLIDYRDLKKQ